MAMNRTFGLSAAYTDEQTADEQTAARKQQVVIVFIDL
jgi:5-deoxy-D-glucuronate isomerase